MDQLLYERNALYPVIRRALNIVHKYIIDHKLLLVGGQAIDYVLREHGSKLYDDHAIPDYDFFSVHYYRDATAIGNLMLEAGISDVNVIRAKHLETCRVRIANITVADVNYVPQTLLDTIPHITHNNMRVLDVPGIYWYMHLALIHPFSGAPATAIEQRWWKDMERYETVFAATEFPRDIVRQLHFNDTTHVTRKLPKFASQGVVTGYAALSLRKEGPNIVADYGVLEMYSDDMEGVVAAARAEWGVEGKTYMFNSLMDILPECLCLEHKGEILLRVYNNKHSMISTGVMIGNITAVNAQGILLYLLLAGDGDNYLYLKSMVEQANSMCKVRGKYTQHNVDEYYRREYYSKSRKRRRANIKIDNPEQLLPSVKCYGATNIDPANLYSMECARDPAAKDQLPRNIYYKKGPVEPVDHQPSKYHMIDGLPRVEKKLTPRDAEPES